MKFSKYLKRCLQDLEASPEYESDKILVHLVKIQRLTEQIHNWVSRVDEEDDIPNMPRAPLAAYQGAFEVEIERQRQSLPASLKENSQFMPANLSIYITLFQSSILIIRRNSSSILCLSDPSPLSTTPSGSFCPQRSIRFAHTHNPWRPLVN